MQMIKVLSMKIQSRSLGVFLFFMLDILINKYLLTLNLD